MTNTVPSYKNDVEQLVTQLTDMIPADKFAIFNKDAQQLATDHSSPLKLQQGDTAPEFSLPNASGKSISLSNLLQQGPVVVTFYRGVWCPYCNLQLKNYQQILPQLKAVGASLLAISPMTPDHSLSAQQTNELEFEVLSDIGNKVAVLFTTIFKNNAGPVQAMAEMGYDFNSFYSDETGEIPVPATFVIAQDATILLAHSAGGDYRKRTEAQAIIDVLNS
ncbi:AhpC/Tsa family protein GSU0066 [hydrothermal vent metagenome]|uniref:thioredoxin-dependent peroxiredoxin n=1 Tax=hydrothermal vent metagenome TaxID=652676 RepID=A0A3B1AUI7_9ZZZZ